MYTEEELIKIIENKALIQIKTFFIEEKIKPEEYNYFKNIILYLIKKNSSIDKIKY